MNHPGILLAILSRSSLPCAELYVAPDGTSVGKKPSYAMFSMKVRRTGCWALLAGTMAVGNALANNHECDWHQVQIAGPSRRHSHAMVYDSARQKVVLFGGLDGGNERSSVLLGDTWEWDGTRWTKVADTGPSARLGHAMVYDSARGVVLLFGGSDGVQRGDTWEWNGVGWRKLADTGPRARSRHAMAYDSVRGVTVLFGGIPREPNDTLEWDGSNWKQVASLGPVGRSRTAMAYDPVRQVTVLFGGRLADGQATGDTWEWNGLEWRQVADNPALRRSRHPMIYDSARGVMVVFGGNAGPYLNDTLEWDGTEWRQVATAGPSRRMYHAMAYDSNRRTALLFGGWDSSAPLADTWEYRCPTTPAGITLGSPAYRSDEFQFFVPGATNLENVVLGSTDLTNWVSLRTNRGPFTFMDHAATNFVWRYYRVLSGP